ncbi:hypothetical protein ACQ4PT_041811 [Festuca glaucescens]
MDTPLVGSIRSGMLVFLIGDDSEKKPYTRASRALLSDIEYGCLPQDILHGIPCKFLNGIVVCEVRDYRPFLSNGGDSSGYDFPKMDRVALRLGTECVIKDLSFIADPSWTYHHQLIAESTIINSLQPRLNLDPTPCLEKLCNSVKKMKRDGYTLCNSTVCNGFSVLRQQSGDVSQLGYLTGEHSHYQGFSPCVAKSVVINECQDTSFSFQKRLQDVQGNVRQQGRQQWGLPDVHSNVLHQGSQQWGLPDVHSNVLHQGSQQCGLPDAQANVRQLGNTQQWRLPDAHANVWKQGSDQQWGLPYVHANVPHQGSNQQWGLPGAHANVSHQGSSQQWGLPGAQTNVVHQGSNQQWGVPSAHANVPHQGRQQWGLPDPHANLLPQGRHQWGMPDVHANALHQGSQQWVQPGQCPTMASVDTSHFLKPNYPAEQQYNSRVPGGVCSMDQHQHHYLQNRHPGFSDRYASSMNTGFYDQWHQTPPQQLSSRTHQWGFQDFGRQTNSMPQMHAGRGMRLSVPHPVGSSQMSSPTTGSDVSVTSFLVPPSYPYPPHGNGIS